VREEAALGPGGCLSDIENRLERLSGASFNVENSPERLSGASFGVYASL